MSKLVGQVSRVSKAMSIHEFTRNATKTFVVVSVVSWIVDASETLKEDRTRELGDGPRQIAGLE